MAPSIQSRKGQTLLEVMIALFVLVIGFLGVLTLLSQSLFLSKTVSSQTIATYLAAEGIELAKNLTDHDIYQAVAGFGGWPRGGNDSTFPATGDYQIDYTTCVGVAYGISCGQAPAYAGTPLRFDPATNLYSYAGPTVTPFTRDIKVQVVSPDEMIVDSIVSWSTGPLTSQDVDLEDVFYNWRPT